ncbi:MAG: hypothetical protein H6702_20465, partial [Myxococcales bacterium]|nr:hypothetical protein [Myxococcales bacterium]
MIHPTIERAIAEVREGEHTRARALLISPKVALTATGVTGSTCVLADRVVPIAHVEDLGPQAGVAYLHLGQPIEVVAAQATAEVDLREVVVLAAPHTQGASATVTDVDAVYSGGRTRIEVEVHGPLADDGLGMPAFVGDRLVGVATKANRGSNIIRLAKAHGLPGPSDWAPATETPPAEAHRAHPLASDLDLPDTGAGRALAAAIEVDRADQWAALRRRIRKVPDSVTVFHGHVDQVPEGFAKRVRNDVGELGADHQVAWVPFKDHPQEDGPGSAEVWLQRIARRVGSGESAKDALCRAARTRPLLLLLEAPLPADPHGPQAAMIERLLTELLTDVLASTERQSLDTLLVLHSTRPGAAFLERVEHWKVAGHPVAVLDEAVMPDWDRHIRPHLRDLGVNAERVAQVKAHYDYHRRRGQGFRPLMQVIQQAINGEPIPPAPTAGASTLSFHQKFELANLAALVWADRKRRTTYLGMVLGERVMSTLTDHAILLDQCVDDVAALSQRGLLPQMIMALAPATQDAELLARLAAFYLTLTGDRLED